LELLRDRRLDRIGEQLDGVAAQEDRVPDHSRAGHHDIAYTEIDLNFQTHVVHARIHEDACTLVLGIFRDLLGHRTVGEEGDAVALDVESCTVLDERQQARLIGLAFAEHVDIHGGTRIGDADRLQQEGAFSRSNLSHNAEVEGSSPSLTTKFNMLRCRVATRFFVRCCVSVSASAEKSALQPRNYGKAAEVP